MKSVKRAALFIAVVLLGAAGYWGLTKFEDGTWTPRAFGWRSETVNVACVYSSVPGWLVGYSNSGDALVKVLDYQHLEAGPNENVSMKFNSRDMTDVMYLVLHADTGVTDEFDFPVDDQPQRDADGDMIMAGFSRSVLDSRNLAQVLGSRLSGGPDGCDTTRRVAGFSGQSFILLTDYGSEVDALIEPDSDLYFAFLGPQDSPDFNLSVGGDSSVDGQNGTEADLALDAGSDVGGTAEPTADGSGLLPGVDLTDIGGGLDLPVDLDTGLYVDLNVDCANVGLDDSGGSAGLDDDCGDNLDVGASAGIGDTSILDASLAPDGTDGVSLNADVAGTDIVNADLSTDDGVSLDTNLAGDGGVDASLDVNTDGGAGTDVNVGGDGGVDASLDASTNGGASADVNAGGDGGVDASLDAGTDGSAGGDVNVGGDGGVNTSLDVNTDGGSSVDVNVGGDGGLDVSLGDSGGSSGGDSGGDSGGSSGGDSGSSGGDSGGSSGGDSGGSSGGDSGGDSGGGGGGLIGSLLP